MRLLELPLALCPSGRLSLAALAARTSPVQRAFAIHLSRAEDSFVPLTLAARFAIRGTLQADYPVTQIIADAPGPVLQLDGIDATLGEQTLFDALSNHLLLFLDDEILSVAGAQLLADGLYQLRVVRGRYATPIAAHAAGAEAWLLARRDLVPLQHESFQVPNPLTFKITLDGDLDDAEPIVCTIAGRGFTDLVPANLRVNDDALNPRFSSGDGIQLDWTLTDPGADYFQSVRYQWSTVLEFQTGAARPTIGRAALPRRPAPSHSDAPISPIENRNSPIANAHPIPLPMIIPLPTGPNFKIVPWRAQSLALSNADLVALLGTEQSFTLRARTRIENENWVIESANTRDVAVTLA